MRGKTKGAGSFLIVKMSELKRAIPDEEDTVIISSVKTKKMKINGLPYRKEKKQRESPPSSFLSEVDVQLKDIKSIAPLTDF